MTSQWSFSRILFVNPKEVVPLLYYWTDAHSAQEWENCQPSEHCSQIFSCIIFEDVANGLLIDPLEELIFIFIRWLKGRAKTFVESINVPFSRSWPNILETFYKVWDPGLFYSSKKTLYHFLIQMLQVITKNFSRGFLNKLL